MVPWLCRCGLSWGGSGAFCLGQEAEVVAEVVYLIRQVGRGELQVEEAQVSQCSVYSSMGKYSLQYRMIAERGNSGNKKEKIYDLI